MCFAEACLPNKEAATAAFLFPPLFSTHRHRDRRPHRVGGEKGTVQPQLLHHNRVRSSQLLEALPEEAAEQEDACAYMKPYQRHASSFRLSVLF